jgi:hypothetical protein
LPPNPLPRNRGSVEISISIPAAEFQVYVTAAGILARIMGTKAPNAAVLVASQFGSRGAEDIADAHLDLVDWPPGPSKPSRSAV